MCLKGSHYDLQSAQLESVPSGREDISQQGEISLVLCSWGKLQSVEVGKWNPEILSLPALIWAHCNVPICSTGKSRVNSGAERRLAFFTVLAPSIGYVERQNDTIALFQKRDSASDFRDDPHVLVSYGVSL